MAVIHRFDKAKRAFEQLAGQQPERPEPEEYLGYLAEQAHDSEGARHYFEAAFAAGGDDPRMCLALAGMERGKVAPEKIIPILERAVASKPDDSAALLQLGLARIAARRYEAAISALLSIQDVKPQGATPLFSSLAYAWLQTGDVAQARKYAETAKKWAASPPEAHGVDNLMELIEARSTGPFVPHPGEQLQRVRGVMQGVESPTATCGSIYRWRTAAWFSICRRRKQWNSLRRPEPHDSEAYLRTAKAVPCRG